MQCDVKCSVCGRCFRRESEKARHKCSRILDWDFFRKVPKGRKNEESEVYGGGGGGQATSES